MLTERHQRMLRNATSETLEAIVEQVKTECPEAFHVETGENETLSQRRFVYEPVMPLPMAAFTVARNERADAIPSAPQEAPQQQTNQ